MLEDIHAVGMDSVSGYSGHVASGRNLEQVGSWPSGVQEAEVRSQASVFDSRWLDPDERLGRKSRLALCLKLSQGPGGQGA